MFLEELNQYSWEETTHQIYAKQAVDVERALQKKRLTVEDFMALISPAATPYLEEMARLSRQYTLQRFGKTISLYIPLYLTNSCTNFCVYCGFNHNNPFQRTILNETEIQNELAAIKKLGNFENLLLVTGENPQMAGVDYLERALQTAHPLFANLSIEVMPLKTVDYERLIKSGLYGLVCFQETYNQARYKVYHPKGMKSKFEWRLEGFDRMGEANIHKIGMGVLLGLEEWRTDVTMLARHLRYLQKHYWQTQYSINFPRLRPSEGHFQPNVIIDDRSLAQLIFAFRIFDHDVDISISTRESASFRDNMLSLGISSLSAGSKTEPGGYATYPHALEQFHISDERSPMEIVENIRQKGYEPIWKDWERWI